MSTIGLSECQVFLFKLFVLGLILVFGFSVFQIFHEIRDKQWWNMMKAYAFFRFAEMSYMG